MRGFTAASCLLALLAVSPLAAAGKYVGQGTAYSGPNDKDATGFNACGFGSVGSHWERFYGAMNSAQFSSGICGSCVRVRGIDSGASGKSFLVKIVDECPTCAHGDVDFSTTALEAITGFSWDRKAITWEWASCDGPTDARGEEQDSEDSQDDEQQDDSQDDDQQDDSQDDDQQDDSQDASQDGEQQDDSQDDDNQDDSQDDSQDDDNQDDSQDDSQDVDQQDDSQDDDQQDDNQDSEDSAQDEEDQDEASPESESSPTPDDNEPTKGDDEAKAQPVGTYRDWVVECSKGRKRCRNLALASQGYQCMNLKGDSCCLTGCGKGCVKLDSFQQKVEWDGVRPSDLARQRQRLVAQAAARKAAARKAAARKAAARRAARRAAARKAAVRKAAAARQQQQAGNRKMLLMR